VAESQPKSSNKMPKLIILRGNSGSGKTTVANELRQRMGYGTALIEQDYIRRKLLREKDRPGQPNIELIELITRFALERGSHVILEGILPEKHYGDMLRRLVKENMSKTYIYYFDVSFDETLRRHETKPNAHEFGEKEMREWYEARDLLGLKNEILLPEKNSLATTVNYIFGQVLA
jgi:adenylylsulfate kinase-like enzyme